MADTGTAPRVAVLGRSWGGSREAGFALRALAAALSRMATVEVLVPGPPGPSRPDGAFDLVPVGGSTAAAGAADPPPWPSPDAARWPAIGRCDLAVVDDADPGAVALADRFLGGVPAVPVVSRTGQRRGEEAGGGDRGPALAVGVGEGVPGRLDVGLHVPVHALAAAMRHVGVGYTGYLLVLGDRGPERAGDPTPTPLAAWLATRFADRPVVVIENAVASVWRARSLRGSVTVDSRADLWRLVAHARVTVDLAPGPLLARECVESLRYGVPVVVPAGTAAARLAAAGGGLWYEDEAELLGCVEALDDDRVRDTLGAQGREVADRWYGDPARFVGRVADAAAVVAGPSLPPGAPAPRPAGR